MKSFPSQDIRNLGLIGHKASGKTSVAESILWAAGVTGRLGKTADGTSVLDYEDEEKAYVMSTSSAVASFVWKKRKINLLDTPGDVSFLAETKLAMRAMDAAICCVSAKDGVEPMTDRVFGWAGELGLAKVLLVTKMDAENADLGRTMEDIKKSLCPEAAVVQMPLGQQAGFRGVVDLLTQRAYLFSPGDKGEEVEGPIPDEFKAAAEEARNHLIEDIAAADESLMEKFFEGTLTNEEIAQGLAAAMAKGLIVPVYCASGLLNHGVTRLFDVLAESLPGPNVRPPIQGSIKDAVVERRPYESEPLAALVFKTIMDQHSGRISVMRLLSGKLSGDVTVKNGERGQERLNHVSSLVGKKLEPIQGDVYPGDVFAVAKLKEATTGDTLSIDGFVAPSIAIPPALISRAIHAKDKSQDDKLTTALHRIHEEDPGLRVSRDEHTGEILLSGAGERHVSVAVQRLQRKFGVACELHLPRIPYNETLTVAVKGVEGKHKKQSGGHGQFGVCYLDIEPGERGSGFVFEDAIVGGAIPRNFIPSVEKGLLKALSRGLVAGYPVVDVRVRVYDGKYHAVDSSDMAFQVAASKGIKSAVAKARPALLEPIMNVDVVIPEANMGDVMGDINHRRGRVLGTETNGRFCTIRAQVPLAEIQTYEGTLSSITQGRGSFTAAQSHMEIVPTHLAEKIIKESGFVASDDEE